MKKINTGKTIYLIAAVILAVAPVAAAQQKTADKTPESCPLTAKTDASKKTMDDCPLKKKTDSPTAEKSAGNQTLSEHHRKVLENGARAMGFSQTATTHHFLIMKDGGAISVEANDARDTLNRDRVRAHLSEIAEQFQKGNFKTPFAVHSRIPPGVPEMEAFRNEIRYRFEETEKGGRVTISTDNPQALAAIHRFLKFQIEDHQTGDPT